MPTPSWAARSCVGARQLPAVHMPFALSSSPAQAKWFQPNVSSKEALHTGARQLGAASAPPSCPPAPCSPSYSTCAASSPCRSALAPGNCKLHLHCCFVPCSLIPNSPSYSMGTVSSWWGAVLAGYVPVGALKRGEVAKAQVQFADTWSW